MNRAVFLDRDGVLNASLNRNGTLTAPWTVDELQLCAGVPEALAELKAAGFLLVMVTNQPDVARGHAHRADVDAIHARLRELLPLDGIRVCFHDDQDRCACRKPAPGMLICEAVEREIRLDQSFMVGDRWRDIDAGRRAGCRTVLVKSEYKDDRYVAPDHPADDLRAGAKWILDQSRAFDGGPSA